MLYERDIKLRELSAAAAAVPASRSGTPDKSRLVAAERARQEAEAQLREAQASSTASEKSQKETKLALEKERDEKRKAVEAAEVLITLQHTTLCRNATPTGCNRCSGGSLQRRLARRRKQRSSCVTASRRRTSSCSARSARPAIAEILH